MSEGAVYAGIDVSKAELEVAVGEQAWTFPNDVAGIEALVDRLWEHSPELVVLEATGGHETAAVAALDPFLAERLFIVRENNQRDVDPVSPVWGELRVETRRHLERGFRLLAVPQTCHGQSTTRSGWDALRTDPRFEAIIGRLRVFEAEAAPEAEKDRPWLP